MSLTVLLPLLLVAVAPVELGRPAAASASSRNSRRRVNWWFNALNSSFGAHQAAVVAAHRQAITGVYQWIQPAGFWVKADGSVSFPPPENIIAATAPLLAMDLESGVCLTLQPGSLESGGALRTIPALVATAEKFNITSYIVDLEYPGPVPIPPPPAPGTAGHNGSTWRKANGAWHNGTCLAPPWVCWSNVYCSAPEAHRYADFLRALVEAMHAKGRRAGLCIEMGCIIGPEVYWQLYSTTGVDFMHSMGSTYTGTNVSLNEQWLRREVAAVGPTLMHTLSVGIGSVSPVGAGAIASCGPPNVPAPWPTRYNWTEPKLADFVSFISSLQNVGEIALFRHDMMQMETDCVSDWYYTQLEQFLRGAT